MWYIMQMVGWILLSKSVQMNVKKPKRYPGGEFDAFYSENRQEVTSDNWDSIKSRFRRGVV